MAKSEIVSVMIIFATIHHYKGDGPKGRRELMWKTIGKTLEVLPTASEHLAQRVHDVLGHFGLAF
jgi:hypothetical protein